MENGAREDLNAQFALPGNNAWDPTTRIEYSPALCNAAAKGHADVVRLLLDEGAQVTSRGGLHPLHIAALNGHEDIFNLLLEHGAKITTDKYVMRVEENSGIDLLCCAVRGGNVAIFEQVIEAWPRAWLMDEACSDMYSYYKGRGPIAVAAAAGHAMLVTRMIELCEAFEADDRKTAFEPCVISNGGKRQRCHRQTYPRRRGFVEGTTAGAVPRWKKQIPTAHRKGGRAWQLRRAALSCRTED